MALDKDSRQPLYQQLMEELKNQINQGVYCAGDQIPPESELANLYGVSRITVRKTIEDLVEMGYLVKQQGKGTFVDAPVLYRKIEQKSDVSFTKSCEMNGKKPSSKVLISEIIHPNDWVLEYFRTQELLVRHIERLLSADDIPIILEDLYLPKKRFENFDVSQLENGSFYRYLKEGMGIDKTQYSRSTIEVGTLSGKCAQLLKTMAGEPAMIFTNYVKDSEENPLYISKEKIVGKRYLISI